MKINYEFDEDGCIDIELIENSVDWHKEKGGDNILLQYINGGENMRIVERFADDVNIAEAHYQGKSLMIKFSDGNKKGYYQDDMGNYKSLKDLKENRQNKNVMQKGKLQESIVSMAMLKNLDKRIY